MAAVTLRGTPARELIPAAAAARFDAVGIRLSPWEPTGNERLTPRALGELRDLSSSLGVFVHDVEQIRLLPGSDPGSYQYLFEGAARLGARYALVYADEPDDERFIASLCELEATGRPYGVHPVIEMMPFTPLNTVDRTLSLLRRAQLEEPALLVDTLHLARSGAHPGELDTIDPEWIPFIHLADGPMVGPDSPEGLRAEAGFSRLLPGHGDLPLTQYLSHLPPGVPLALEVPGASHGTPFEQALAAAEATRALLDQLPESDS